MEYMIHTLLLLFLCYAFVVAEGPVHVHLAYGALDNQMQVTFASSSACGSYYVLYTMVGGSSATTNATATKTRFTEGNFLGKQYVYNALLEGLVQGEKYNYVCVCDNEKTDLFQFTAKPSGNTWSPNLLVFGDMGRILGPQALPGLIKEVEAGWPNTAIHVGDFAYDMDTIGGIYGDVFMNQIQDIAAYIPYMVAVGNHEANNNFSHYINRFNMPNTADNMWFSWNLSMIHFIAYSTEVLYFEDQFPAFTVKAQLDWLEQDLIEANSHRDVTPWIIAYGHRPFYCSNAAGGCLKNITKPRKAFEELFHKYGVDIVFEGHEHSYERLWPVYNGTVVQENYDSPQASVHIITGCAGCNEDLGVCVNPISGPGGPWSAFRASGKSVYGYGKLQVFNSTHVYWEEVEAESQTVLDSVWITQKSHGPFM